jgi:hypothetical protein
MTSPLMNEKHLVNSQRDFDFPLPIIPTCPTYVEALEHDVFRCQTACLWVFSVPSFIARLCSIVYLERVTMVEGTGINIQGTL